MTSSSVELAWAAGMFEGEGSIRITKRTRTNMGHLAASVVNTDLEVIEFFQDRWPGGIRRATGLGPRQRQAWVWITHALKAAAFIEDVIPYLRCERVLRKAHLAIAYQRQKQKGTGRPASCEYTGVQFGFYLLLKELNLRGAESPADPATVAAASIFMDRALEVSP